MAKITTPAAPVAEPLTLPATVLAPGVVGVAYDGSVSPAEGGTAPYAYAVSNGALPDGLPLGNDHEGAHGISGEPKAAGVFTFEVTATDATGAKVAREYALRVDPEPEA